MKRSKSTMPSFADAKSLMAHLGATRDVRKVLIANNGLAAVKGIRSLHQWFYDHVGDEEALQICVMASPEDMKANAEFVHMADEHVVVPGGSNANNYANVDLIMSTAVQQGCDAVYPGWGHASENPALPRECLKSQRVTFLGPSEKAMFALGDKIASTIIAQSNGVPTAPWSGDFIRLEPGAFDIDPATYESSYVRSAEECEAVCQRIGFPVMIKASEGGGGKGIRRVLCADEVRVMFEAVQEEVKGCHIFVMRMLENVRHLEVQLLADAYGNCIAVRTRDCSVQRRHQKIIEEGPVVGVDADMVEAMEAAAIRLALAVGYVGLGTVEYMYDKNDNTFSFLELNPRIQVEHPVSELISGVDLPAALLCVGMGVRLDRIPEVRTFYGEFPYESSVIDFTTRRSLPPRCHAIAVRITAEDVDEAFRPTTGTIDEISFRNSKECWGYFSVSSGGAVHQFADSQFGHIFSTGETREDARRGMVLALRGICVRGEIRTSTAYVLELLERQEFRDCDVSTAWLDGLIAKRMKEKPDSQTIYPALLAAAVIRMKRYEDNNIDKYISFLQAGHTPSVDYLSNSLTETFVVHSQKYVVEVGKLNPSEYCVGLNGSVIIVPCRVLNTGGLQLTIAGRTVVAYGEEEPTSLRVTIQGKATTFTGDVDPTKLRSSVPGRLVRFLIPDGGFVQENAAYAEVEVMKMILPLRSAVSGIVQLRATAGCTVSIGRLLAEVVPEDASKIKRPEDSTDPWPESLQSHSIASQGANAGGEKRLDAVQRARQSLDALWSMMTGYHVPGLLDLRERTQRAISALPSIALSSVNLRSLNRPYLSEAALEAANTPVDKLKAAYAGLVEEFLRVEKRFDVTNRQDAIAAMRDEGLEALAIYHIDFAHHHTHRHEVLRTLLEYLETNRMLMVACEGMLNDLSSLHSANYGLVLLKARYLVRQCGLPSFDERKSDLARQLEQGSVEALMKGSYGFDLMCAVMFDQHAPHLAQLAVELFIRRAHFGVNILDAIDIYSPTAVPAATSAWFASYHFATLGEDHEPLQQHRDPMKDATVDPVRSFAADPTDGNGFVAVFRDDAQAQACLPYFLETVARDTAKGSSAMVTVFYAVRQDTTSVGMADTCGRLIASVKEQMLSRTSVTLFTFLVHGATGGPYIYTFRRSSNFEEDVLYRNVVPTSARRLELSRLQNYTLVKYPTPHRQVHVYYAQPVKRSGAILPVEHRLFVRMFVSPRDLGVAPWSCISEVEASHAMSLCITAMEFARSDKKFAATAFNHFFIHMVELSVDASTMLSFFKKLSDTYRKKLFSLGVREAEIKFKVKTDAGFVPFRVQIQNHTGVAMILRCYAETTRNGEVFLRRIENKEDVEMTTTHLRHPSLSESGIYSAMSGDDVVGGSSPLRVSGSVAPLSRHSSLQCVVSETYRVAKTEEKLVALRRLLPPRTVEPFQISNDSFGRHTDPNAVKEAEHGEVHLGPYPILPAKQIKRLLANSTRTTYVHDWMVVLEVALRQQWKELVEARGLPKDVVPPHLIQPSQLFVDKKTKQLTLQCTDTIPSGMVVWVVEYYPPTYASLNEVEEGQGNVTATAFSRRIVVVANDITFQSGSFAVPEDVAFKLASDFARSEGLPFVYLSANSGARLGLCTQVKDKFRVSLANDTIEYLYLTPEDYAALTNANIAINVERIVVPNTDNEVRFKILDIVGAPEEFLGVENLQGSALIAGHMSLNYATIPTISVATGRTVGIGAYLVRLGRRVVQTTSSPIILTGAGALNRLLGKEVYSDNCQLGGHTIMVPNGVTHWEAKNDLNAVHTVLKWLNYVPEVILPTGGSTGYVPQTPKESPLGLRSRSFASSTPRQGAVPWKRLTLPQLDPTDRDVTYAPGRDESYDPRFLVHGNPAQGTKGLFDDGSWMETLSGWAKTVVAGRAALGGIPCGVILVETRITKKFDPADPADPNSTSTFVSQAGQVWFPDSARKTADALEDFHKERLPCFILANWRGFSGGMRDMYDEVLKFGASIVDNLRVYDSPVFIYIPPFGELRGGAWVVVDPVINHRGVVEMYCDTTARGGILEPAGVVEIKFREADVRSLIRRNDASVAAALSANDTNEVKRLESRLLPLYNDVAVQFADLHDTPGRMKAKRCIVDVIPWRDARRQFSAKLERKLKEIHVAQQLVEKNISASLVEALDWVAQAEAKRQLTTDKGIFDWLCSEELEQIVNSAAEAAATDALRVALLRAAASKDITAALQDPAVRTALEAALRNATPSS